MTELSSLAAEIKKDPNLLSKLSIQSSVSALGLNSASAGTPGDDAAALPRGDGYDLFAMEGFVSQFVEADPWNAGWCSVMVNLSDILAMGGRATAITNAIWAPNASIATPILEGMRAAAEAYNIPVVGGHTNLGSPNTQLAASIMGRATNLITSFDAEVGDILVCVADHRGEYRPVFDNFQSSSAAPKNRLREDIELLPQLAEENLVFAGKDISQGGIIGTAIMLAECSNIGIEIEPQKIQLPPNTSLLRWLKTFPSFGFLLAVKPAEIARVCRRFTSRNITANAIGNFTADHAVHLVSSAEKELIWNYKNKPYLGLNTTEITDA